MKLNLLFYDEKSALGLMYRLEYVATDGDETTTAKVAGIRSMSGSMSGWLSGYIIAFNFTGFW